MTETRILLTAAGVCLGAGAALAAWLWRRAGPPPRAAAGPLRSGPLPVRVQADPIRAFKRAALSPDVQLMGIAVDEPYKADDRAVCAQLWHDEPRHPGLPAPQPHCTCGFHAVSYERLEELRWQYPRGCADLEVELYGTIRRHRDGYRAERQRVLGVYLDPVCRTCKKTAAMVAFPTLVGDPRSPSWRFYTAAQVARPLCWDCVPLHRTWRVKSPAELASILGVEVRWGRQVPLYENPYLTRIRY